MSQLKTNLQEILAEKQQKIVAENIRRNVSVFGVIGTLDEGIDTSDADAVAGDLADGKTAYVNGTKITGTIPTAPDGTSESDALIISNLNDMGENDLSFEASVQHKCIAETTSVFTGDLSYNEVATVIGLSADKIKQGETILGIAGTVVPEDPEHADYDDCLQLTEEILGNI